MSTVLKEAPTTSALSGSSLKARRARLLPLASAAIISLTIFSLLNLFLWKVCGNDKSASKDLWSGTGSIDLALNDFKSLPTRPNVVLMGSSLMMFPFWAMDKDRYPAETSDIFHYHHSRALENALKQEALKPGASKQGVPKQPVVFNMAIFGQMASDAYLYVDEFLKGNKRPDYLVLGMAPRDFYDSDVPSPMATMTFKRLVTLENFPQYASLYLPTWQSKIEFVTEHLCFFYGKRWHLQREFDKGILKADNAITQICGLNTAGAAYAAPSAASGNSAPRGFLFAHSSQERWQNSLDEYRRRYSNIENNNANVQMGFFNSILDVCRQRGIKAVVVNMPLTDANRALLPPGWYSAFSHRLNEACQHSGAYYLDLGSNSAFVHSDYWDTTHLAHPGGYKLVDALLPALVDSNSHSSKSDTQLAATH